jgi:hypothetical protein
VSGFAGITHDFYLPTCSPRTLHKIHVFVEAQQEKSRIRHFFRQVEMAALLKECRAGLDQALSIFKVSAIDIHARREEATKS